MGWSVLRRWDEEKRGSGGDEGRTIACDAVGGGRVEELARLADGEAPAIVEDRSVGWAGAALVEGLGRGKRRW